jgi:2-dehydropantoate 2-reductase
MRIGVVGAGAMGSLFGARLVEAGARREDVVLVDINRPHIEAMQARGLIFEDGAETRTVAVNATADHGRAGKADLIVLFCKHPQTPQAIRDAIPMMHEETYVWTPQNGIGNVELIAEIVPGGRIAKGLTSSTSIVTAPGRIRTNFQGATETFIWPVDGGEHPRLAEVAELLTAAGLPTTLAPDIDYRIWRKLCVNTSLTALTAAVNTAIGPIGESEAGQRLMRAIVAEVVAVANARGIGLQFDDAFGYVEDLRHKAFAHIGSTTMDMQAGRPTEIEAMCGAVVREGERLGIATPANAVIADIVRILEATRAQRLPVPV